MISFNIICQKYVWVLGKTSIRMLLITESVRYVHRGSFIFFLCIFDISYNKKVKHLFLKLSQLFHCVWKK